VHGSRSYEVARLRGGGRKAGGKRKIEWNDS
jgi:hypothetical protein